MKYMQRLGGVGASRKVAMFSDGDGDFRPKFGTPDLPAIDPMKNKDDFKDVVFDAG